MQQNHNSASVVYCIVRAHPLKFTEIAIAIMKIAILLFAIVGCINACSLVPGGDGRPGSCQNLQAQPLISSGQSQFGPFMEGASVNREGQMFATNFGNANTLNQLGKDFGCKTL